MTAKMKLQYLNYMKERITSDKSLKDFFENPKVKEVVEAVRQHYNKVYGICYYKEALLFHIEVEPAENYSFNYESQNTSQPYSSARFSLKLKPSDQPHGIGVIGFEITQYPYCCGMRQMNGFTYQSPVSTVETLFEKLVPLFTSICVNAYMEKLKIQERRLMINFVEYRNGDFSSREDVPSIDAPNMKYPLFHEWAMKQQKYRASLMYNRNSGNIIHHAEVVVG